MKPKGDKKPRQRSRGVQEEEPPPPPPPVTNLRPTQVLPMFRPSVPLQPFVQPSINVFSRMSIDDSANEIPKDEAMSVGSSSTSLEMRELEPMAVCQMQTTEPAFDFDMSKFTPVENPDLYAYRNPTPITVPSETSLTGSTSTTLSEGPFVPRTTPSDPNVTMIKEKVADLELDSKEAPTFSIPLQYQTQPINLTLADPLAFINLPSTSTRPSFEESARMFQANLSSNLGCGTEIRGRWQDFYIEGSSYNSAAAESQPSSLDQQPCEEDIRLRPARELRADAPSCVNLMASLEEEGTSDEGDHKAEACSLPSGPWYDSSQVTQTTSQEPLEGSASTEDVLSSDKQKSENVGTSDEDYEYDDSDTISDLYSKIADLENDESLATPPTSRKRKGDDDDTPSTAKKAKSP